MRRNTPGWTARQSHAARWLQRSGLKSSQAWRLKMGLRAAYAAAREHNSAERARAELSSWVSWARRCRLDPFKKLAATVRSQFAAVIREMFDHRSEAFVKAMNGLLQ
jgi:transposase